MANKPTILIVDDEAANRNALRAILGDKYELLEASDGQEAISLLTTHEKEIEAIILDLLMPRMDGWAFLEQYGKAAQWKDIPVLAASGDERSQTEHRCLEMGAWDFIRKPFDPTTVYFRLKNNISRRHVHLLEKQKITDVFQRYVDPSILAELLRSDITEAELRGKTAEIAVLFVDIRGFTSLSEKLPPEDVVELLNLYLTLTSSAVKQHGGKIPRRKAYPKCFAVRSTSPLKTFERNPAAKSRLAEIVRSQISKAPSRIYQRRGREFSCIWHLR